MTLRAARAARRIAIVGAERTGKSRLCAALVAYLQARGLRAATADVAAAAGADYVIADGAAVALAGGADAALLMGLDLPRPPESGGRGAASSQEDTDALLRTSLQQAGAPFQVVYGSGGQRLQSALAALVSAGVLPQTVAERPPETNAQRAWQAVCEKCSDPACEHRLFTRLREPRS
ncbi:MAG TPA: hypothetical protein VNB23_11500 [Ramlibacter sp.]|nr:hypothetical protein [Ramlibacter sp.]